MRHGLLTETSGRKDSFSHVFGKQLSKGHPTAYTNILTRQRNRFALSIFVVVTNSIATLRYCEGLQLIGNKVFTTSHNGKTLSTLKFNKFLINENIKVI